MTTIYAADGLEAWEYQPNERLPSWFGVFDRYVENYRITFFPEELGTVSVGIDARWTDTASGLANFTADLYVSCGPEECGDSLTISDNGLLIAMERAVNTASSVNLRKGLTLQLPIAYVAPVRLAIAKAHEMAKARADAATAGKPVDEVKVLTTDEYAASEWYATLLPDEYDHWARQAGRTGLIVDAWRASQTPAAAPFGWAEVTA